MNCRILIAAISFCLIGNYSVSQEVGFDDFRISTTGVDGDVLLNANESGIAYNSIENEYFVVWQADTIPGELEIYGARLDENGNLIGNAVMYSDMGVPGDTGYDAVRPSVTWNATNNEYLIVWSADDDIATAYGKSEIFGQLVNNLGVEIGTNDFIISYTGPVLMPIQGAFDAELAWNSTDNNYLVVWESDSLQSSKEVIHGQLIDESGNLIGTNKTLITIGLNTDVFFDCINPSVAYNANNNEFMIVFEGDHIVPGDEEAFMARFSGNNLTPLNTPVSISNMSTPGSTSTNLTYCEIAWNSISNEYLVVWRADSDILPYVVSDHAVWGQLLDSTGLEIGTDDFPISNMGTIGDGLSDAMAPDVAYSASCEEYRVVWHGDSVAGPFLNNKYYIWTNSVSHAGLIGTQEYVGIAPSVANTNTDAHNPAIAYNSTNNEFLITFSMDSDLAPLVNNEKEIYGQRYACTPACSETNAVFSVASCESYTSPSGQIWTASSIYNDTILNAQECDSIITIDLTINNVDNSITDNGSSLTSNAAGGTTYQWLDCDDNFLMILGETSSTFTPMIPGNYAVQVAQNECIDTSECYTVISNDLSSLGMLNPIISVFPNPTGGDVTLLFGTAQSRVDLVITNISGQIVSKETYTDVKQTLDTCLPIANGIYFIEVINASWGRAVVRVLKK